MSSTNEKVLVTEQHLQDIADAIRGRLDVETTYRPGDMAAAIDSILKPDGALVITRNGYQDVKQFAAAQVEVPNSYAAQDEGKVVSSGALVAQTSRTISANGTYDTTTNNEVTVDAAGELEALTARLNGVYTPTAPVDGYDEVTVQVPTFTASVVSDAVLLSGEQVSVVNDGVEIDTAPKYITKTITQNGTYDPGDDNAQAYSSVVVNVSGGGGGGEPLPMAVTASSTFSQSPKQPSGIFGDVAGNFWGSNGTNNWLNINFTTPFNLKKVRLSNYYRVSTSTYWYSSNITVRASNDGFATYTDLYTGTGLAQSDTQFEIDLNNSDAYIEYRFIVSDTTAYAGIGRVSLL